RDWAPDSETPFERMRVLDPAPEPARLRAIERNFKQLFPQFEKACLKVGWGGMIDAMPDVVPVVDRVQAIAGLLVATGMSGHGFGI
ncbi:FAD-binding oxidoreductase, partial [Mesorhizobium sp. M2D.F.Ca.ET.140.01.1.1]